MTKDGRKPQDRKPKELKEVDPMEATADQANPQSNSQLKEVNSEETTADQVYPTALMAKRLIIIPWLHRAGACARPLTISRSSVRTTNDACKKQLPKTISAMN
jgi:hypothetical protein